MSRTKVTQKSSQDLLAELKKLVAIKQLTAFYNHDRQEKNVTIVIPNNVESFIAFLEENHQKIFEDYQALADKETQSSQKSVYAATLKACGFLYGVSRVYDQQLFQRINNIFSGYQQENLLLARYSQDVTAVASSLQRKSQLLDNIDNTKNYNIDKLSQIIREARFVLNNMPMSLIGHSIYQQALKIDSLAQQSINLSVQAAYNAVIAEEQLAAVTIKATELRAQVGQVADRLAYRLTPEEERKLEKELDDLEASEVGSSQGPPGIGRAEEERKKQQKLTEKKQGKEMNKQQFIQACNHGREEGKPVNYQTILEVLQSQDALDFFNDLTPADIATSDKTGDEKREAESLQEIVVALNSQLASAIEGPRLNPISQKVFELAPPTSLGVDEELTSDHEEDKGIELTPDAKKTSRSRSGWGKVKDSLPSVSISSSVFSSVIGRSSKTKPNATPLQDQAREEEINELVRHIDEDDQLLHTFALGLAGYLIVGNSLTEDGQRVFDAMLRRQFDDTKSNVYDPNMGKTTLLYQTGLKDMVKTVCNDPQNKKDFQVAKNILDVCQQNPMGTHTFDDREEYNAKNVVQNLKIKFSIGENGTDFFKVFLKNYIEERGQEINPPSRASQASAAGQVGLSLKNPSAAGKMKIHDDQISVVSAEEEDLGREDFEVMINLRAFDDLASGNPRAAIYIRDELEKGNVSLEVILEQAKLHFRENLANYATAIGFLESYIPGIIVPRAFDDLASGKEAAAGYILDELGHGRVTKEGILEQAEIYLGENTRDYNLFVRNFEASYQARMSSLKSAVSFEDQEVDLRSPRREERGRDGTSTRVERGGVRSQEVKGSGDELVSSSTPPVNRLRNTAQKFVREQRSVGAFKLPERTDRRSAEGYNISDLFNPELDFNEVCISLIDQQVDISKVSEYIKSSQTNVEVQQVLADFTRTPLYRGLAGTDINQKIATYLGNVADKFEEIKAERGMHQERFSDLGSVSSMSSEEEDIEQEMKDFHLEGNLLADGVEYPKFTKEQLIERFGSFIPEDQITLDPEANHDIDDPIFTVTIGHVKYDALLDDLRFDKDERNDFQDEEFLTFMIMDSDGNIFRLSVDQLNQIEAEHKKEEITQVVNNCLDPRNNFKIKVIQYEKEFDDLNDFIDQLITTYAINPEFNLAELNIEKVSNDLAQIAAIDITEDKIEQARNAYTIERYYLERNHVFADTIDYNHDMPESFDSVSSNPYIRSEIKEAIRGDFVAKIRTQIERVNAMEDASLQQKAQKLSEALLLSNKCRRNFPDLFPEEFTKTPFQNFHAACQELPDSLEDLESHLGELLAVKQELSSSRLGLKLDWLNEIIAINNSDIEANRGFVQYYNQLLVKLGEQFKQIQSSRDITNLYDKLVRLNALVEEYQHANEQIHSNDDPRLLKKEIDLFKDKFAQSIDAVNANISEIEGQIQAFKAQIQSSCKLVSGLIQNTRAKTEIKTEIEKIEHIRGALRPDDFRQFDSICKEKKDAIDQQTPVRTTKVTSSDRYRSSSSLADYLDSAQRSAPRNKVSRPIRASGQIREDFDFGDLSFLNDIDQSQVKKTTIGVDEFDFSFLDVKPRVDDRKPYSSSDRIRSNQMVRSEFGFRSDPRERRHRIHEGNQYSTYDSQISAADRRNATRYYDQSTTSDLYSEEEHGVVYPRSRGGDIPFDGVGSSRSSHTERQQNTRMPYSSGLRSSMSYDGDEKQGPWTSRTSQRKRPDGQERGGK